VAVALADRLGALIDPGSSGFAFAARGASTATLGDVRDRAEIVVIWRADPVTTHPRLFERLQLPAAGRELVVVDTRRTPTAEAADTFVEIADEVEGLLALRTGTHALAGRLRAAANVAILHHVADPAAAIELHALVRDLDQDTHAVSVTLRREANAAGAEDVLAWQTGYAAAVSFARGHPREAATLDADAALVIGADVPAHLRGIPLISIDPCAPAEGARIAFATAAAGVHRAGVVHRLDGVPVPLRAPVGSERPGDDEVLAAIAERLG
jgi:formylmethanofuran dehydrogenase subunit B